MMTFIFKSKTLKPHHYLVFEDNEEWAWKEMMKKHSCNEKVIKRDYDLVISYNSLAYREPIKF